MHDWSAEIEARLAGTKLRPEVHAELVDELSQHMDEHYAELRAHGESEEEARRHVIEELDAMNVRSAARERARPWRGSQEPLGGTSGGTGLTGVLSDLRFGARVLWRNPGLAIAAIVTLAVGIGANTAIFSAVNAVILRPLPFPEPAQLYRVWEENPEKGWYKQVAAPANYLDWKEGVSAFQDVAAYAPPRAEGGSILLGEGPPQLLRTADVSGNFFSVLRVKARQGRVLRADETWSGNEPSVVLSENAWQTKFGGRPVLDRSVRIDGRAYRVVGIMPREFTFPESTDAWLPFMWDPGRRTQASFRRAHWLHVIGRAKPGVPREQINAQLQTVVERLKGEYPATNRVMGAGITPLQEFMTGDMRTPLMVLLSAVGLLLLIACANVGNLLLVKATTRGREMAVRRSLGATGRRLTRQLLTEGIVLAALGSAGGIVLGWGGTRLLERLQPAGLLSQTHFEIDLAVLGYVVLITIAAGLAFGSIPAFSLKRNAPGAVLRQSTRSGAPGRGARRTANALVVAEVAIAVMLVVGAGLLVRTFRELQKVPPGVDPEGVLAVTLQMPPDRYDTPEKLAQFYTEFEERARRIPGAKQVALSSTVPLAGHGYTTDFSVAGRSADDYGIDVAHRTVTAQYFETMKVPVLRGRAFTTADHAAAQPVVIINDAIAQKYFGNQDPIGQRITFDRAPDSTAVWATIVGVVGNEHQNGMDVEPHTEVFVPLHQDPDGHSAVLIKTDGDPLALVPALRGALRELDADLPLQSVRTVSEVLRDSVARQRFMMTLLLLFAGIALFLATVGVYGVTAQGARQRRQEIGVRMAMGAQPGDILRLVVSQGAVLVCAGVAAGVAVALLASRALGALLYGVSASDPLTYVAVSAALIVTGLTASWLPARSASLGDPAKVLRSD